MKNEIFFPKFFYEQELSPHFHTDLLSMKLVFHVVYLSEDIIDTNADILNDINYVFPYIILLISEPNLICHFFFLCK